MGKHAYSVPEYYPIQLSIQSAWETESFQIYNRLQWEQFVQYELGTWTKNSREQCESAETLNWLSESVQFISTDETLIDYVIDQFNNVYRYEVRPMH